MRTMILAALLALALPALAQQQANTSAADNAAPELRISFVAREADGGYAVTATVRIPMASSAEAHTAASTVRFWIATGSDIEAAAIYTTAAPAEPTADAAGQ